PPDARAGGGCAGAPKPIPHPLCDPPPIPALRVEYEHGCAIGLVTPCAPQTVLRFPTRDRGRVALPHPLPVIRGGPNRDEHLATVHGENNVPRDVPALH